MSVDWMIVPATIRVIGRTGHRTILTLGDEGTGVGSRRAVHKSGRFAADDLNPPHLRVNRRPSQLSLDVSTECSSYGSRCQSDVIFCLCCYIIVSQALQIADDVVGIQFLASLFFEVGWERGPDDTFIPELLSPFADGSDFIMA